MNVVCVMGLGYIGLPTATTLARCDFKVFGFDSQERVRAHVRSGKAHIVEPGLQDWLEEAIASQNLSVVDEPVAADVFIICVPTPVQKAGARKVPDLTFVENATDTIAPLLKPGDLVILESTSPIGTTRRLAERVHSRLNQKPGSFHFAYCPERVLPGRIAEELVQNDRVVGGVDGASTEKAAAFYRAWVSGKVLETTAETAEMTKLAENSFRDLNIAFANELSMICDDFAIDPYELIELANRHPRVNILQPGPGVGGHCIAVDPWFLVDSSAERAKIIRAGREVNDSKTEYVVDKVKSAARRFRQDEGRSPKIAAFGLAFKPDIDDVRESPAMAIAEELRRSGEEVLFVDPYVEAREGLELTTAEKALQDADLNLLLVKHRPFLQLQFPVEGTLDFCGLLKCKAAP
ncbi:MAG: UDP-N-acetyl-D-mannosamine dehydrogenase [Fimbriimonadaceae bacterium]